MAFMAEPNVNPYESPREATTVSRVTSRLDLIFFLLNFFCCIAFIFIGTGSMVESYFGSGSPFGMLGGPFFIVPATLFAIGEWQLFVRKREGLRRPLGFGCGIIGAFWAFGFVANVLEGLSGHPGPDAPSDPPDMVWFWLIFGSICAAIVSYNAVCCWYRFRYQGAVGRL